MLYCDIRVFINMSMLCTLTEINIHSFRQSYQRINVTRSHFAVLFVRLTTRMSGSMNIHVSAWRHSRLALIVAWPDLDRQCTFNIQSQSSKKHNPRLTDQCSLKHTIHTSLKIDLIVIITLPHKIQTSSKLLELIVTKLKRNCVGTWSKNTLIYTILQVVVVQS